MLKKSIRLLSVRFVCFFAAALTLAGCVATPTSTIKESADGLTLADSYIGEDYNDVMARAESSFEVEPQCETRKVGLKNSRKAFFYAVCGFNPENARFAEAPLAEVVYHFIDEQLVRVDIRALGEAALLEQIKDDMQQVFSSRNATSSELGKDSHEWVATQYVAGVRAGGGANQGNIHVRLYDQSLSESAPWLAKE